MANTNYIKNKAIIALTGGAALSVPGYFIGVSSSAPAADGTGVTEPAIGTAGYARLSFAPTDFGAPVAGVSSNVNQKDFPKSTGDWLANAPLTHFTIYDAATGGNLISYSTMTGTPQGVVADTVLQVAVGALTLTFS